jgi:signal transduction histidine kinase
VSSAQRPASQPRGTTDEYQLGIVAAPGQNPFIAISTGRSMDSSDGAAVQRLEHERRMLARLAGIEGVACLLAQRGGVIAPQGHGGVSLRALIASGPMAPVDLLQLAGQLAGTLGEIHRRGVLHQNIHPECIVIRQPPRGALLTDFHLATTMAEEVPGFTHHRSIRGNLFYLAPEQTGRIGRSVDLRADLYALGAVLYEACTGRPPFEATDPLDSLRELLTSVPTRPLLLRADLPEALSAIIMRLLEKEPERRYQSGEGLAHDLAQLQRALSRGGEASMTLGENDFPVHLSAPARLVGRDAEIATLRQALQDAVEGRSRLLLVSGPPGVGKTSLVNELRPMVTQQRGWFVAGKFDQYRRDAPPAPEQAFRALARLLLAEPENRFAIERERILEELGAHAGLVCAIQEFALLLGPQPEVPDVEPAQAEGRLVAAMLALLRAVVSPQRPVVMFLDDLQWAKAMSVHFMQAVAEAPGLEGLLVVGSYRDSEVDEAHPLATLLSASVAGRLVLGTLTTQDVAQLLREMMRLPSSQAAALASLVTEHAAGNPFHTVELLNALRRDGLLQRRTDGWTWDAARLRRHVGATGVLDLLAARVERLPAPCVQSMRAMACLGGQISAYLLCAGTGLPLNDLHNELAPALEDGLVVIERGNEISLRLRHDRVQQAIYGTMPPGMRGEAHLALARRLAPFGEFGGVAAQQYVPAIDYIHDEDECRRAANLMRQLAVRLTRGADFAAAHALLSAALTLLARVKHLSVDDVELRNQSEVGWHVALCGLGRFEEADELFRVIEQRGRPVQEWADAACAQVDSLRNLSRSAEAIALGFDLLGRLGLQVPEDLDSGDVRRQLREMARWTDGLRVGQDTRAYSGDARCTAAARLICRVGYPAYFSGDLKAMRWFILQAHGLWVRHGPSPELVHALCSIGGVVFSVSGDYRGAGECSRHVLGVAESRGWELEVAEARYVCATHAGHWFDPIERTVRELHLARAGTQRNGDIQSACFTYRTAAAVMLDCEPTLAECIKEVEKGLELSERTRNDYVGANLAIDRQMLASLLGESAQDAGVSAAASASVERLAAVPIIRLNTELCQALTAAVFGDAPALARHADSAFPFVQGISLYLTSRARLLHALSLAQRVKAAANDKRAKLLAELDTARGWLAARAADCPANFLHLSTWIDAERAWALGEFREAACAFDAALSQVETLVRPWHHALIAERAGLFHLQEGMAQSGRQFIARSRDLYAAWGAAAKVAQMEKSHAFLSAKQADAAATSVDTIDALAILRASQALSSETSLGRLQSRIVEVVGALTGATSVRLALRAADQQDWIVFGESGCEAIGMSAQESGRRGLLPLSALRYAQRSRAPVVIDDAASDDRFSSDPFLQGMANGSLLVIPILNQGIVRAALILENRLTRGAFTAGRLDAVSLIAGQLAVSLENAMLYDSLEKRVQEQTRELLFAARRTGMAQVATNVLHNVGNVLNSVNTSLHVLRSQLTSTRAARLEDVTRMLEDNADDLGRFLSETQQGKLLPHYLHQLMQALSDEREQLLAELQRLDASVDHIKNVVAMQQSYAGSHTSLREPATIVELVEESLRLHDDALARERITIARDYGPAQPLPLDRSRVMQILVNLVENARQAMASVKGERVLRVTVRQEGNAASVEVSDTGCGIPQENLPRMFSHGFTTKLGGHGFGLHSCALAASEMGATLSVHSEGRGAGASFRLAIPDGTASRPVQLR